MSELLRKFQHNSDILVSQESSVALSNQTAPTIEQNLDELDFQVKSMTEDG